MQIALFSSLNWDPEKLGAYSNFTQLDGKKEGL